MNIPNSHYYKSCIIGISTHALSFGVDFLEEGMAQYIILYLKREPGGGAPHFSWYIFFTSLYFRDVSFNPAFVGSASEG